MAADRDDGRFTPNHILLPVEPVFDGLHGTGEGDFARIPNSPDPIFVRPIQLIGCGQTMSCRAHYPWPPSFVMLRELKGETWRKSLSSAWGLSELSCKPRLG